MSTISKYYCDKCGEEDKDCRIAQLSVSKGYEVRFALCDGCRVDVFDTFVDGLKGWDRLERNYEKCEDHV